jgi:hypothetical protein
MIRPPGAPGTSAADVGTPKFAFLVSVVPDTEYNTVLPGTDSGGPTDVMSSG